MVYYEQRKRHPNHEMSLETLTIYRVTPLPPLLNSSMTLDADLGNFTRSSFCNIILLTTHNFTGSTRFFIEIKDGGLG